MFFRY
jgi:hypothetical protein